MPAEAGLEERAISFTKGCYPGQEPVARLHYRGHPNRGLRVLALDGAELPAYDAELTLDGKVVGRVTSAAPDPEHGDRRPRLRPPRGSGRRPTLERRRPAVVARQLRPRADEPGTRRPRYTHPSRARSSGDRALPCGGRGRTFESCRAHVAGGGTHGSRAGSLLPGAHGSTAQASRPTAASPACDGHVLPVGAASYSARRDGRTHEFEPEPWGEDPRLVEVLGERGAEGFRALLDGFPEPVGVLWAIRDPAGRRRLRLRLRQPGHDARLPAPGRDARPLHAARGAAPDARQPGVRRPYVEVCDTGEPLVSEVTYDTPFGDGYMLGTFLHRAARLGDGRDRVPPRRHRRAADGGRARSLRRRRRPRPERAARRASRCSSTSSSSGPSEPPAPRRARTSCGRPPTARASSSTACSTTRARASSPSSASRSRT